MAPSSGLFLSRRVYNESHLYAVLCRELGIGSDLLASENRLNGAYTSTFNGVHFADNGAVPAHRIFTNGYTRIIVIFGARTATQLSQFYDASFVQRRGANEYCNSACTSAAEIINQHADAFQGNPANQIIAGYSFGGAIAQAYCMNYILNVPPQATFKCFMFGAPRQFQRVDRFPRNPGVNYFRWCNDGDYITAFPPHADEATTATGLMSAATAAIVARVEHIGQGTKLYTDGSYFLTDTGTSGTSISDLFLWGWFLSNDTAQAKDHSIQEYCERLLLGYTAAQGSGTLSLEEFDPRVIPVVEAAGRVMTQQERVAVTNDAVRMVKESRGSQPIPVPFYTVKRAGVWNCECEGQVISSGISRRNAARMARTMNAAWRSWWSTRLADTTALQNAVHDNFPS